MFYCLYIFGVSFINNFVKKLNAKAENDRYSHRRHAKA
jgi:hypothetical protein